MKVLTIGRELPIIEALLKQEGIEIVTENPDVIVTHGGDGYLLEAERAYPGVPKVPIRHNSICKTCVDHETTHTVKALARGTISHTKIHKLETTINGVTLVALNEFSLHHVKPYHAIRFSVQINDEETRKQAIGDGLIVATPFGSHAYYRSITNSTFRVGIGVAFNNTTEPIDHMIVREDDVVRLKILRGPAYFIRDNDTKTLEVNEGDVIEIRESGEVATLLGLDHFRCPDCGTVESVLGETEKETV